MIRVMHVVFSLAPGGMENGILNVANRLDPDEFKIDFCCLEKAGEFAERIPQNSDLFVLNKPSGKAWSLIPRIARLVRDQAIQIVHSHDLGPLIYTVPGTRFGTLASVVHGEHCQFGEWETTGWRLWQRRFLYRFCRRIHTVSHDLAGKLAEYRLTRREIIPVPNGVDVQRFRPADKAEARARLGLAEDALVIGTCGRLVKSKRQDDLMRAFNQLAANHPRAFLLIVGDGPYRPELEVLRSSLEYGDRIVLRGFTPQPERIYPAMDLFVLPSLYEGLSNVLLEAMACGIPALAHHACGAGEAIGDDCGSEVRDLHDVPALTAAIAELTSIPNELAGRGEKSRAWVQKQFSIEAMVERYAQLYREVAAERGEKKRN